MHFQALTEFLTLTVLALEFRRGVVKGCLPDRARCYPHQPQQMTQFGVQIGT